MIEKISLCHGCAGDVQCREKLNELIDASNSCELRYIDAHNAKEPQEKEVCDCELCNKYNLHIGKSKPEPMSRERMGKVIYEYCNTKGYNLMSQELRHGLADAILAELKQEEK